MKSLYAVLVLALLLCADTTNAQETRTISEDARAARETITDIRVKLFEIGIELKPILDLTPCIARDRLAKAREALALIKQWEDLIPQAEFTKEVENFEQLQLGLGKMYPEFEVEINTQFIEKDKEGCLTKAASFYNPSVVCSSFPADLTSDFCGVIA